MDSASSVDRHAPAPWLRLLTPLPFLAAALAFASLSAEEADDLEGMLDEPAELEIEETPVAAKGSLEGCAANLKRLHQAILRYAKDHGGELPPGHRKDFPMSPGNPEVLVQSLLKLSARHDGDLPDKLDLSEDVGPGGGLKAALYPKYIKERSVFYCPLHPEFNTDENWNRGRIGYFHWGNYHYESDRDAFRAKQPWAPDKIGDQKDKPLLQDLAATYKEEDPATRGLEGRHFNHHEGLGVHVLTLGGEVAFVPWKSLRDTGSVHGQIYCCTEPTKAADKTTIELCVEPLEEEYYDRPLPVVFAFYCRSDFGKGNAEVALQNVETGERFPKSVPVALEAGIHTGKATWERDGLPNGRYVVDAAIRDGKGEVLASNRLTQEQVKQLAKKGGGTRWFSKALLLERVGDFRRWRQELVALEEKAKAAGADTTLPHLTVVLLREIVRRSKEHLQLGWFYLIDRNHTFLKKAVAETKQELARITREPSKSLKLTRPDLSQRLSIRDGYFHSGDQPVFLCGPGMFNFVIQDLPVVRDFGFNLIGVSTGPDSIFPDSEEPTGELRIIDYNTSEGAVVKVLARCQELGLKVDLGLTSHFMPGWLYEKHPDAKNRFTNFMMPYDIEHPAALELIKRFYGIVMPKLANHPAVNSIWVANEPGYSNFGERNLATFRTWLQGKYRNIEALNAAWGTIWKSFDEIRRAPRFEKERQVPSVDWWHYSQARVTRHFAWMKSMVRKHDQDVPVCVKTMHDMLNPYFRISARINQEEVSDMSEALGFDCGTYPFAMCYYDWLRSLSPEKPLMNLEFYAFGPAERTKLAMWKAVMHGVAATDWWCWHPKDSFSSALSKAASMYHCARETFNIQRLFREVMAFNRFPRSPFVFLYPDPVLPRSNPYFKPHDAVSYAIRDLGYTIDYVTEKRVAAGRLKDYRIIVLPSADHIREETYKRVTQFVRDGGVMLLIGALPRHDEAGKERNLAFIEESDKWAMLDLGGNQVQVRPAGRGKIYRLEKLPGSRSKAVSREAIETASALLEKVIERELPPLPVRIRGCASRTVRWEDGPGGRTWLTFLPNESRSKDLVLPPNYRAAPQTCTDLITGEKTDPHRVSVPPWSCRLLRWTEEGTP